MGNIGSLQNYYLFEHSRIRKRSVELSQEHHQLLSDEPDVHWFDQQVEKRRVKRDFQYYDGHGGGSGAGGASGAYFGSPSTHSYVSPYTTGHNGFPDPLWKEQWYLTGGSKDGFDMNVQAAWKRGYTGKGVTVSILDDGIQTNHPDLVLNYDPRASTDINDNDNDPYPQDNGDNKHGTRCAGEVAATAGNNICGVGVAYNASIGGVRMLDGTVNDAVEAKALGLNPDHIDIFSASWGPEDDGKTVDGPGPLARRAFISSRHQGGRHVDSCNCDGYTNSIFTLSISSATQGGYKPWYLEECSSTLATTYSSGTPTLDKSVATVDMDGRLRPDHICTVEHTGTSASAPLAAGIAALALEANTNLSWRDLQHLVVITSRPDPLEKEEGWYINGVQRKFSHKFGYGLMDAGKMVDLAVDWAGTPPQHICKSREIREDREVPGGHLGKVKVFMDVDGCAGTNSEIRYLEHVQCKISLRFFPRGNLRILLTSPMGTTSVLLFERPRDVSSSNFDDWPFLSVHFWGEQAHGRWTLEIINSGSRRINQPGMLKKWQLILYGTDTNPIRLKSRSLHQPTNYQPTGSGSHASYRAASAAPPYSDGQSTQLPPRFVPQEYLFGSGSEVQPQTQGKSHMVRSQCQNEYWVRDLAICVNDCPDGYFEDTQTKECLSCPQRCKSCHNSTSCTACEHNLVLFGTTCMSKCPERYFEADSSCEACPVRDCASCAGLMGNECVQCKEGYLLQNNECVNGCAEGKRASSNGECVQCQTGCLSCGETKCFRCIQGFQLSADGAQCLPSSPACPATMFLDEHSGQCVGCGDANCARCHGAGNALSAGREHFSERDNASLFVATASSKVPMKRSASNVPACVPGASRRSIA
ncbi:Furin-like protease 2 [Orchesella cincta]|uniref:furin n=1 Tax=Orchesella cincta TaxID=48709 RepID=A0A1D2MY92_ORCCI|nr:Furin-like protease 2 [Orchesella cincta]